MGTEMECTACGYHGTVWTVEIARTYTGELDSTRTVVATEDDLEGTEHTVKCPECGE